MTSRKSPSTRRQFLRNAAGVSAGVIGFPYIVSSAAVARGAAAPSNRIVMGAIGTGGMGNGLVGRFMGQEGVQMVAVCDVDAGHRNRTRNAVNERYGNQDCAAYNDYRELLARDDIDAVIVATPDHWHALAGVAAANAGKDIYCEKPLANSVGEGRAICEAVKRNNRVLQTGSHERSNANGRFACELVRNGRIGRLHTIRINLPCNDGHHNEAREQNKLQHPEMAVPEGFDYDMWLGHTPKVPYTARRCHFWWRFILSYGGGEMTDRGAHIIDIGQLGNGTDDTGPVEFEAEGERSTDGLYDAFMDYRFVNRYANGVTMIGTTDTPRGLKFEGTEGSIMVHIHGCRLEADPPSILEEKIGDDEIQLGRTPGHAENFLDAIRTRKQPFADAEVGHRTGTICHLNNIAMLTGRKIKWDPQREEIIDDSEASRLLTPRMRSPWTL